MQLLLLLFQQKEFCRQIHVYFLFLLFLKSLNCNEFGQSILRCCFFSLVKKLLKSFKCSFCYYLCKEDTSKKALTQKIKKRNSADIYIFFFFLTVFDIFIFQQKKYFTVFLYLVSPFILLV